MKPRILVVEDDPVSQEIISSLLISRGFEIDTADDGFGALRLAQETNYDLVFIDYHLPEMDGYALARLMRSLGEKTNAELRMVAITADQFGLAARRGVDTIFDRMLSKPIEPETLFAFVDEFLGKPAPRDTLENFLASGAPSEEDTSSPSLSLWNARGIDKMPAAAVFPAPTTRERASVAQCFRIVEPAEADCLILLHGGGLGEVASLRRKAAKFLQPLFVVSPELAPMADAHFEPADGESWTRVAGVLKSFAGRQRMLTAELTRSDELGTRLGAHMFVSDRSLDLVRGDAGGTIVPYTAGYAACDLIEAVKQLAARGLVTTRLEPVPGKDLRRLVVTLSGVFLRQGGHENDARYRAKI